MHDDGVDAGLLQQGDIFRESLAECRIPHGVTTIFYHDGLVLVFLHEGQSLCEQPRLSFAFGSSHGKTSVCGCGPEEPFIALQHRRRNRNRFLRCRMHGFDMSARLQGQAEYLLLTNEITSGPYCVGPR
ncbi:hypothetical protein D3C80_1399570 [compost metagenome]